MVCSSSSPILYENVRKTALNFQKFLLDLNTDYFGHYHIIRFKLHNLISVMTAFLCCYICNNFYIYGLRFSG